MDPRSSRRNNSDPSRAQSTIGIQVKHKALLVATLASWQAEVMVSVSDDVCREPQSPLALYLMRARIEPSEDCWVRLVTTETYPTSGWKASRDCQS